MASTSLCSVTVLNANAILLNWKFIISFDSICPLSYQYNVMFKLHQPSGTQQVVVSALFQLQCIAICLVLQSVMLRIIP